MRFNYAPPFGEECSDKIRWTVIDADIDVDSNNDGIIDPDNSSMGLDDPIEVAMDLSGRIVFINDDDDDQDDVTDFDQEPLPVGEDDLVQLDISLAPSITDGRYRLVYDAAVLEVYDSTTTDIIVSEEWQDAGVLNDTLWIEGLMPSEELGDAEITLEFDADNDDLPECDDKVNLTVAKIEYIDLSVFGPRMTPEGNASVANSDFRTDVDEYYKVEGAVTDGASLVLLRIVPDLETPMEFVVREQSDVEAGNPWRVGSLTGTDVPLPDVPAYDKNLSPGGTDPGSSTILALDSMVIYRPPNNLLIAPKAIEYKDITIEIWDPDGEHPLTSKAFTLRRPPLLLVHGLISSPSTWNPAVWASNSQPYNTLIHKVDYEDTNLNGFEENYGAVVLEIGNVVNMIRSGTTPSMPGKRIAACRVDIVGHSMGGMLSRWYIADKPVPSPNIPSNIVPRSDSTCCDNCTGTPASTTPGPGFSSCCYEPLIVNLFEPSLGKKLYLRDENFGAGDIRRLITLGSPHLGSPLGNHFEPILDPDCDMTTAVFTAGDLGIRAVFFGPDTGNPTNDFKYPNAVPDLAVGSKALQILSTSTYPSGHKTVWFHPLVGIATNPIDDSPTEALLYELLFNFVPGLPGSTAIQPLNPTVSDLIVPAESQRAGTLFNDDFPNTHHAAETGSDAMATKVGDLLTIIHPDGLGPRTTDFEPLRPLP